MQNRNVACSTTSQALRASSPGRGAFGEEVKFAECQGLSYSERCRADARRRGCAKADLPETMKPRLFSIDDDLLQNLKKQVDDTMREIQVAEHKTLKLTNVLSRKVEVEDMGNLAIVLTQMQNFIRSHDAMPVGPIVQCVKMRKGPNPTAEIYFMQQVNQLIPRLDPGYQMDALLRVRNCLYAHYTGPMSYSNLASQKLDIYAFEHEIETTGDSYSVYVNQDDDNGVLDVFMETK